MGAAGVVMDPLRKGLIVARPSEADQPQLPLVLREADLLDRLSGKVP